MRKGNLKTRKSYRQVPITEARCGGYGDPRFRCLGLKDGPCQGCHHCLFKGNTWGPDELVPKDFGALCDRYRLQDRATHRKGNP